MFTARFSAIRSALTTMSANASSTSTAKRRNAPGRSPRCAHTTNARTCGAIASGATVADRLIASFNPALERIMSRSCSAHIATASVRAICRRRRAPNPTSDGATQPAITAATTNVTQRVATPITAAAATAHPARNHTRSTFRRRPDRCAATGPPVVRSPTQAAATISRPSPTPNPRTPPSSGDITATTRSGSTTAQGPTRGRAGVAGGGH